MSSTEADPVRIAGMGVGTFIIFIFSIAWVIIWVGTSPLDNCVKWFWRWISSLGYGIVFVLLIFAEREPRYTYQHEKPMTMVTTWIFLLYFSLLRVGVINFYTVV